MSDETPETAALVERLRAGDDDALVVLFAHYRARLRNMIRVRLDPRVRQRLDDSDVLQETYLDAARQVATYRGLSDVAFYVWLRGLAWQRLIKLQRQHLGAECRAAGRERPLPGGTSTSANGQPADPGTSPSQALVRDELRQRVRRALDALAAEDREVILMRDFEDLTNNEVAQALGLSPSAATMRYGRALFRLKAILTRPGQAGESTP